MKICISSGGQDQKSTVDFRFGRCPYFLIYDDATGQYTALANQGISSAHGAGIAAAQQVIDQKVGAVITGNMGPNAMELIKAAEIDIYGISGGTVEGAMDLFQKGKLEKINQAGPAHAGTGQQGKRGQ